jgi:hypothetical protein
MDAGDYADVVLVPSYATHLRSILRDLPASGGDHALTARGAARTTACNGLESPTRSDRHT